jgi:hypothetical protein
MSINKKVFSVLSKSIFVATIAVSGCDLDSSFRRTSTSETPDAPPSCEGTDCPCVEGTAEPCGSDEGACALGVRVCSDGTFGECVGSVEPTTELCNGLDDDCNGEVDDGFQVGNACDGGDTDSCKEGQIACNSTGGVTCTDSTASTPEQCDATLLDEDCDGYVNEGGCQCTNGQTAPCGSDVGVCAKGTQTCAGGAWGACVGAIGPATEACNGIDDNCDGSIDETCRVLTVQVYSLCNGGTVTSQPSGLSCATTCSASFFTGTSVKLIGSGPGQYQYWSYPNNVNIPGCPNDSSACTVSLTNNLTVQYCASND